MSWKRFVKRRWWDDERAREIESNNAIETAENISRGMPPPDAAAAARRKFGNVALIREEIHGMNTIASLESAWRDLRYAGRQFRLSPGFATVAIASLALGIGANTTIFQLLDAVLLRSLPVQNPQDLAEVKIVGGNRGMGLNQQYGELTRPLWQQIRDHQQAFSDMFAWSANERYVGQGSDMRRFRGLWVTGGFFRVLGVRPWRGRLLLPEDETACPPTKGVVSYSYWQRALGGRDLDADVKLVVNGDLVQIIGVTPPEFFGMAVGENFDIALPFCEPKEELRRDVFEVSVMGRLKPGWTIQKASAELNVLSPGIFEATVPPGRDPQTVETYKHFRLAAYPASGGVSQLRETYDRSLFLLLGITGLVLLIACANLANLMLARASARGHEIAVRLALGASRRRLLRQLLAESGLLAVLGAGLGAGLAAILSRSLIWSIAPEGQANDIRISTDWRVLLFTTAIAVLTCAVFGVAPAIRATRTAPGTAMKAGGRGTTADRERFSLQRTMVVTQISVSLVLLTGALLFVRSFRNLVTFDPGMRERGVTVAFLGFWQSHLAPGQWAEFQRQLLEEVQATPGVLKAATTTRVPLDGGSWEHGVRVGSMEGNSKFTWVSPDYFAVMAIPVVRGRGFNRNDTATSPRVAVVNRTFERRFLAGANPLGKTLRTAPEPNYPSTVYEIAGVIPDTKYSDLRGATPPMTFAPSTQNPNQGPWTQMMIESDLPAASVMAAVKSRIGAAHPGVIMEFSDFQKSIRDGLLQERLMATLSGFFGVLAAVLAMAGLYGVMSYTVARRRNEIGIRLALGAERRQVIVMVMRDAGRMLIIGLVIGAALALTAGRTASALLFGLTWYDPFTLLAACGLLLGIAAVASFLPARQAAKLDPMSALRYE
jgi:predicted permease